MKIPSAAAQDSLRAGRPKSEAKRMAILEASSRLFLENGFKDTSVDAVAAEAGVSKQTVYSHFGGKDALLRACVESKVQEYGLSADDLPTEAPLLDALRHIGRQFIELLNDPNVICMYRLLISEAMAHPALTQAFFEAGPRPTNEAISRFLATHPQGGARFGDTQHASEVFFALLEHTSMMHRLLNLCGPMSQAERAQHAERTAQGFLRMFPA